MYLCVEALVGRRALRVLVKEAMVTPRERDGSALGEIAEEMAMADLSATFGDID